VSSGPISSPDVQRWKSIAKGVLVILVLAMVGRYMWKLTAEWRQQPGRATLSVSMPWLAVAAVLYGFGMSFFGLLWRRLLAHSGAPVGRAEALRVYFVGALGKYVPGKAFVLVLRTGMLSGRLSRLIVALSVFYETLAMMAVGGFVSALCLLIVAPSAPVFWGSGLAVLLTLAPLLHPAIFERGARVVTRPLRGAEPLPSTRGWWRIAIEGIHLPLLGWLFLGASCAATVRGMGYSAATLVDFVQFTGVAALACSAGFLVIFMPSGIGVREMVVVTLLSPRLGASQAVIAALLLRTVWTLADVVVAGALYWIPLKANLEPNTAASHHRAVLEFESSANAMARAGET